jgi:hypothetical protein
MSFQNRNFNTQQSGGTKVNWFASSIRQLPIDPFIDGKVTDGSILYWSKPNQYWTALDKNVKRLTCYGQYLIWDGTTWIIVGDQNVRLGCESGKFNQGSNAVAIGNNAGYYNQGENGIAIGYQAGYTGQASETISIGSEAGSSNQGNNSIGIGLRGGFLNQGSNSVALGNCSGETKQGNFAISVGFGAGASAQNDNAIAIGRFAGLQSQSVDAISIGRLSGFSFQKEKAIAIGYQAGYRNQGSNSIAIGPDAGYTGQHSNSIILSATGGALNSDKTGALFVNPISLRATGTNEVLYYDSGNSEIFRASNFPQNYPVAIYTPFVDGSSRQRAENGDVTNLEFTKYIDGIDGVIIKGWTYDPTSTYLTCPDNGLYIITCTVNYDPPENELGSSGNLKIYFTVDPIYSVSPEAYGAEMTAGDKSTNNINLTYIFNLSQNNKIKVQLLYDNEGGFGNATIPINSAYLTIHKIGNI